MGKTRAGSPARCEPLSARNARVHLCPQLPSTKNDCPQRQMCGNSVKGAGGTVKTVTCNWVSRCHPRFPSQVGSFLPKSPLSVAGAHTKHLQGSVRQAHRKAVQGWAMWGQGLLVGYSDTKGQGFPIPQWTLDNGHLPRLEAAVPMIGNSSLTHSQLLQKHTQNSRSVHVPWAFRAHSWGFPSSAAPKNRRLPKTFF